MGTTTATINPHSYRIALGELNPNNVGQLRKLNSVLFPVHYSDKFYKEVLDVGEFAKLGRFRGGEARAKLLGWRMTSWQGFWTRDTVDRVV